MPNRAFRLILCLGSVYVCCVTIFNVFVGSFSDSINISLLATGLLTILQILNLAFLYKYDSKMLTMSFVSEALLIFSSVWTMIVFPYLLGQLIFGVVVTLFTFGLIFVAKKDLSKRSQTSED